MRDNMVGDGQLFQPDVLLPTQFFAAMKKRVPREPEYRLIVAVLEDAIDCYQKHLFARDPKARQLFDDAAEWIDSDDRAWPYSFVSICEILNLNPEYVRRGLHTWKEDQTAGHRRGVVLTLKRPNAPNDSESQDLEIRAS
jgi:hypothetical protein